MKYKIIDAQKAAELAREVLEGTTPKFSDHEQEVGKGVALSDTVLAGVAQEITKHQRAIEKRGASRETLDAVAFEIVHRRIPSDSDMLSDSRFWTRFTLVYLFDVIKWRFPGKGPKGFNLENLGIGGSARKRAENYLYKLWVRGELSHAADPKDPYKLGRCGSIDFWTSHVHRQGFANCRNVATELIKFQYPPHLNGKPRLLPGEEDVQQGRTGVRTLVKRIRRLWATVEYTLLESGEVKATIHELAKGLIAADGKSVYA